MQTALKWISFAAMAAASYAGVGTLCLMIPGLYPTAEMTARVQGLLFQLAAVAFLVMATCWIAAKRMTRKI